MSSQYDVSVGGLDFADTYLGLNNTYWNASNNVVLWLRQVVHHGAAVERFLRRHAAGAVMKPARYITYGSTGFCNTGSSSFHQAVGGSGGPSACATGTPACRRRGRRYLRRISKAVLPELVPGHNGRLAQR